MDKKRGGRSRPLSGVSEKTRSGAGSSLNERRAGTADPVAGPGDQVAVEVGHAADVVEAGFGSGFDMRQRSGPSPVVPAEGRDDEIVVADVGGVGSSGRRGHPLRPVDTCRACSRDR